VETSLLFTVESHNDFPTHLVGKEIEWSRISIKYASSQSNLVKIKETKNQIGIKKSDI